MSLQAQNCTSDEIARLTAEFEAGGGSVQQVPKGATGMEAVEAMRAHYRSRGQTNSVLSRRRSKS